MFKTATLVRFSFLILVVPILSAGGCSEEDTTIIYLLGSPGPGAPTPVHPILVDAGSGLTGVTNGHMEWGDYDNDGDLDVALMGNDVGGVGRITRIYRNDGGVFTDIAAGLPGLWQGETAWGDYDNDGDLDLFVTGLDTIAGEARLYRNDGADTFTEVLAGFFTGVVQSCVAWGDFNNDGNLDLVVGGIDAGNTRITTVYQNNGNGTFTDIGAGIAGSRYGDVAWADYDGDGDLDLAVTGEDNSPADHLTIYRNDSGVFVDAGAALPAYGVEPNLAWGDHDNDGDPDLAVSGQIGATITTAIYRNDGGGTFTDISAGLLGLNQGNVSWGDLDRDGDLDLMTLGYDGVASLHTRFYRNDGNDLFVFTSLGVINAFRGNATFGDYDGDGDLDMAICGQAQGGAFVSLVYRNDAFPSGVALPSNWNRRPSAPTGLASVVAADVTLQWAPSSDTETPSAGLSYNLRIGTAPDAQDVLNGMSGASGYRKIVYAGPVQAAAGPVKSWVFDLPTAGTYYWSVQAVDSGFVGSEWAAEGSFVVP